MQCEQYTKDTDDPARGDFYIFERVPCEGLVVCAFAQSDRSLHYMLCGESDLEIQIFYCTTDGNSDLGARMRSLVLAFAGRRH